MASALAGSSESFEALGQSEVFLNFQERLSRVAKVDRPVLLIGERGTGKELAARRLHFLSRRWKEPLVALNCAALSPTLIESELFGHEAGAFTGATGKRPGRFEAADGGTLFLDELGNIPAEVQEKILRVVEYGCFERVGGSQPVEVDVRILGATNADLPQRAREGRFMQDLLDRLSFEVLYLPPLRERQEDILLLAHHFAARMAMELGRDSLPEFSAAVEQQLQDYPWPGNIRELKNVVERAVYQAEGTRICTVLFDPFQLPWDPAQPETHRSEESPSTPTQRPQQSTVPCDFKEAIAAVELQLLQNALNTSRFNQRKASELLGLRYDQFRGVYRKYADQLRED